MAEKAKILLSVSESTIAEFVDYSLIGNIDVIFCPSEQDILQQIDIGTSPAAIVIENHVNFDITKDFLDKIENHTSMQYSLNLDLFAMTPVIALLQDYTSEEEIFLLNNGVSEVIDLKTDSNVIYHRVLKATQSFTNEIKKFLVINKQHEHALTRISQLSGKTGIFNKQTFIQKTKEMLSKNKGKPFIFIQFDIDRFKVFNDLFGFSEGDKILMGLGEYFIQNSKKNTQYGHIYADHFIICTEKDNFSPETFVKEITTFTNRLFPKFDFIVRVGLYEVFYDGKIDISLACDRAQLALHSIKADFSARYAFFSDDMITDLKQEQELITDMVIGIRKNEFKIYIQPQYDYTTDSMSGAEALVRWMHPTKGLISPSVFIPVFERNGFITQLDQYIWDKTCAYIRKWKDMGLNPVPISVNVSRRDIYNQNLVAVFSRLLKKYNLTPDSLRLEITESAYMDNPSQLINVVKDLKNLGFCLEMDDFGSGYSSLNTLKDVPVDILKLDMQFIIDSTEKNKSKPKHQKRSSNILTSVVRMANLLQLPVIAEGIESKAQADYLKSIGCFHMQGFYFSKPMPAEEFEAMQEMLPEANPELPEGKEEEANGDFLDSASVNNMLFNKFVGAAAIIEWSGDKLELLQLNNLYLKEIGTSRAEYSQYQKDVLQRIAEKSRPAIIAAMAQAVKTKRMEFCEIEVLPLGTEKESFWLRIRLVHLSNTATGDIFFAGVENIDFRMHLLELTTTLSEQLASILGNAPCGFIMLENNDGKFYTKYVNENAAQIAGYEQSEFRAKVNESIFDLFVSKKHKDFQAFLNEMLTANTPAFSEDIKIVCKDNTQKEIRFTGNVINQSNGTRLICASLWV
ncbi:MAG: EAL domain-containing protein [Treponema sp.]|nr:EAL domain-containing protein [Treponema sp.]